MMALGACAAAPHAGGRLDASRGAVWQGENGGCRALGAGRENAPCGQLGEGRSTQQRKARGFRRAPALPAVKMG